MRALRPLSVCVHDPLRARAWQPPRGGATCLVPGTHRLATDPRQTFRATFGGGATIGELPHSAMPNMVECAVPAGTAVAFDSSTWHTSFPNTCGTPRRTTVAGYRSGASRGMQGGPRGQWPVDGIAGPCGLTNDSWRRLAAKGLLPMTRRKLLNLPLDGLP
jgi:hypothetical protein